MKKRWVVVMALAVVFLGVVMSAIGTYNRLVGQQQGVDAAWAQVSNQYQRRADLVPNLVKTVQGSADFEKSTLEGVTKARASVGRLTVDASKAPESMAQLEEFQKAQGAFGSALQRLLVVAERYPDLKASAGFRDLQVQLEGSENRIAVERGRFNEIVRNYNTSVKRFPAVLLAGVFGFHPKPYFQAGSGAETAPNVDFDFGGTSGENR
jgi:LemA protein